MRWFLNSKIHKAIVTEANLDYVGSITIDQELLEKVDLKEGEKVLVVSNTSGVRLDGQRYLFIYDPDQNRVEFCTVSNFNM